MKTELTALSSDKISKETIYEFIANFTSEHTKRNYFNDMKDFFHNSPSIQSITLSSLIKFRDDLSLKYSPATVSRKLSAIRSFLNWCQMKGLIKYNPAASLKLPKPEPVNPTIAFTDNEVLQIMNKAKKSLRDSFVLSLLFNLGLRRSEIVNLRLDDIYQDRNGMILRVTGKGSKVRLLPLSAELLTHFKAYMLERSNDSEKLIPISTSTIFRIVTRYVKKCGLSERLTPHSCRATAISHLLEKSVSPRDVALFAGHASIKTTVDIYDKKRDGIKNSAALRIKYEQDEKDSNNSGSNNNTRRLDNVNSL